MLALVLLSGLDNIHASAELLSTPSFLLPVSLSITRFYSETATWITVRFNADLQIHYYYLYSFKNFL